MKQGGFRGRIKVAAELHAKLLHAKLRHAQGDCWIVLGWRLLLASRLLSMGLDD